MIDDKTIEDGQVFQPNPEKPNELIRYVDGRWERSVDNGRVYSYRKDLQEQNRNAALALTSIRIPNYIKEMEASYQAYIEDQKRPLYERRNLNVHDGLIVANESSLDSDIDDSLKAIVDRKPLEVDWLAMTIRMLLRDHRIDDPEFDIKAYIDEIKNKVTNRADALGTIYPHCRTKFKHSAAESLKRQITKLLNKFVSNNQPATPLKCVGQGQEVPVYDTFEKLFVDPVEVCELVDVLRNVSRENKKSVLDDTGKWTTKKGSISILIAWVEVLQIRGEFKVSTSNTQMAELLNKYFPGLNLDTNDASIWRKLTDTRNKYHADFLQLIK